LKFRNAAVSCTIAVCYPPAHGMEGAGSAAVVDGSEETEDGS